jgi:ABC-2 type transport system permease protein
MGKLFAVIKREYMERVRSKWFLVATFLGPILLGMMIIIPAWLAKRSLESSDVTNIAILDGTGTALGSRVAATLAGGPLGDSSRARLRPITSATRAEAETTATREVMRKEIRGYLVVDSATLAGIRASYAGTNATSIPDVERIERAVQSSLIAMRLEGMGVEASRVEEITKVRPRVSAERITEKGRGGSGQISVVFAFTVAILLYMLIVLYGQTILRGVMEEKTTRVAEVVVASVKPDILLAGKVMGVGAVGLTQVVLWVATTLLLVRAREPIMAKLGLPPMPLGLPDVSIGTGITLILLFVLGFTFYAALFAAVGSTVNSDQDAQQAATPVMMLVVFSFIFIQPVILNPNGTLARVVSRIPVSAPIIMPARLALVPVPWYEVVAVIGGLVIACALAIWLASRIYRVGLLMYGKRPSMAELARWVKQS